jgi:hypothetical protein
MCLELNHKFIYDLDWDWGLGIKRLGIGDWGLGIGDWIRD